MATLDPRLIEQILNSQTFSDVGGNGVQRSYIDPATGIQYFGALQNYGTVGTGESSYVDRSILEPIQMISRDVPNRTGGSYSGYENFDLNGNPLGYGEYSGDWKDMIQAMALVAPAVGGIVGAASGATGGGAAAGTGAGGANLSTVGTTAAKSAAINGGLTLARGGDLSDALKSAAIGGVTGAVGGGLSAYGVNPIVANAATGATGAALRGGDGSDILMGGATGALSGAGNSGAFTGNPLVDRAIAAGGSTLLRGGSGSDALRNGLVSGANGLLSPGPSTKNFGDVSGDALSEDNIVRFDGGTTVGEDFDWDAWIQAQMDGSNLSTGYSNLPTDPGSYFNEVNTTDPSGEPVYSNEGRNYPTVESTTGPGGSPINTSGSPNVTDYLKTALQKVFQGTGDGKGSDGALWPLLLGGALGAKSSRDQNQTVQRAPWEAAQPYLKGLMADGAQLYNQYKAQPFNDAQKAGYNNMAGLLDLVNRNAGGLLSGFQANASGANQFRRGQPQGLIGSSFNPSPQEWNPQSYGRFGG